MGSGFEITKGGGDLVGSGFEITKGGGGGGGANNF